MQLIFQCFDAFVG